MPFLWRAWRRRKRPMTAQDTGAGGAGKGLGLHYKLDSIPKGWICWGFGPAFWENSVETGPSCESPASNGCGNVSTAPARPGRLARHACD